MTPSFYDATASRDESTLLEAILASQELSLEEASFYFRQGELNIAGIDRAFYLEELSRQQFYSPSEDNSYLLPAKVSKTIGNRTLTIYLDNVGFSTTGASLDAYLIIEDPESGRRICFQGNKYQFHTHRT